jgi:hypothetical protein
MSLHLDTQHPKRHCVDDVAERQRIVGADDMLLAVVKHARQQHAHRLQLIQIANPATDDCRIANFDVDSLDGALIATPG